MSNIKEAIINSLKWIWQFPQNMLAVCLEGILCNAAIRGTKKDGNQVIVVDDKYVWTPKATYDISAVLDYVRKQYTGATIKEIHEKICCTSPVGTLGIYITKSPYFNCIKTYTGGSNFVYRVFAKDQEVHLPVGVIAEGYGL